MTPREAAQRQRQRPQLPPGWPIPAHPANRAPPPAARKDKPLVITGTTAHDRVLSYLRICAAAGYLPYYEEIRRVVGLEKQQLGTALNSLVACGEIMRAVGHSRPDASPDWVCEIDGVAYRTEGARDLEILPMRREAPGSVQVRVLKALRECGDALPVMAVFADRAGICRKSCHEALLRMDAAGVLVYQRRLRQHQSSWWRIVVDGREMKSEGWET